MRLVRGSGMGDLVVLKLMSKPVYRYTHHVNMEIYTYYIDILYVYVYVIHDVLYMFQVSQNHAAPILYPLVVH